MPLLDRADTRTLRAAEQRFGPPPLRL